MKRVAAGLTLCLLVGLASSHWFNRWVDQTELPAVLSETAVEVRDRNGALLRAYPVADGLMRMATHPSQVDPSFVDILLRYEDKRFWTHSGVDVIAMTRAVGQAIWNGRAVSGGSTLTMQVARLLEDGGTGKWSGKLRQMRVALALERHLSKQEILELYLTHAPYGGRLEGVRSASFAWFGKEPKRLSPAQAALLVALPQSPERRRPDRFPEAAADARARVLARVSHQGVIEPDEYRAALRDPVPKARRPFPRLAPHLADFVRTAQPGVRRFNLTIDATVQQSLEVLIQNAAHQFGPRLTAALLVADHQTGEIIASVGSAGYDDARRLGFVDMTRAVRSPGSTLKPLIYGLAFDQGLAHPETTMHDGPVNFDGYAPRNFDGVFRGDVKVREALQMSLNIPVVKLTDELGPARIMSALERSGAAPVLPGGAPGLAVALGGVGVTLEGLVQLYAAMASGGQASALTHILGGEVERRDQVLSDVAAWQVADILRDVPPPSGAGARKIAYKTGTSYGHRDAWAVGWDGQHVIGVWLGRADGTPVPGAFGGELAAPVLFEAFGRVKPAFTPLPPPPPSTLIVNTADLPKPLQRFRPRDAAFAEEPDAPELLFPPNGARLASAGEHLVVKLRGGSSPFIVLADGAPIVTGAFTREFEIPNPGKGFATLVVIDSEGRSDRTQFLVE